MNTKYDILNNQAQIFIHLKLQSDAAYRWSVENNDIINMQIVLRAHGKEHSFDDAAKQLEVAKTF